MNIFDILNPKPFPLPPKRKIRRPMRELPDTDPTGVKSVAPRPAITRNLDMRVEENISRTHAGGFRVRLRVGDKRKTAGPYKTIEQAREGRARLILERDILNKELEMKLAYPLCISARLLPAVRIGDMWLSYDQNANLFYLDTKEGEHVIEDFIPSPNDNLVGLFGDMVYYMAVSTNYIESNFTSSLMTVLIQHQGELAELAYILGESK
jgi:hypothetical protein